MRKDWSNMPEIRNMYTNCTLCPRKCAVNRTAGVHGVCGVGSSLRIARAALHYWEEPCISGTRGSGAVFFSGCALHCVFCQNEQIAQGKIGKEVSDGRLAEILLELQEKGANNINLVTAGQYLPHIIYSVEAARRQGLHLPIVYNTGSYENVETLKLLEGIVDVYLPDFKYMDPKISTKYSHAPDYGIVAMAAIREMVRQQPLSAFYKEGENGGTEIPEMRDGYLMARGVIVRQLLLPGLLADAMHIINALHHSFGDQIYISMMSQFTPLKHVTDYPELKHKVSKEAYERYIKYAMELGITRGFIQEEDVAKESFIPDFDYQGV